MSGITRSGSKKSERVTLTKSCLIEGCGRPHLARGLCVLHYSRKRKDGSIGISQPHRSGRPRRGYLKCSIDGCDGNVSSVGLCDAHYQRKLKYGDPNVGGRLRKRSWPKTCSVEGCGGVSVAIGLCRLHYERNLRHGDPNGTSEWFKKRFEPIIDDEGYVYIYDPTHPNARGNGRVPEHRKVMSDLIGRPLSAVENVHHRNGRKGDNRVGNLELWASTQPKGQRPHDLVAWAKEILELYPPEVLERLEIASRGVGSS